MLEQLGDDDEREDDEDSLDEDDDEEEYQCSGGYGSQDVTLKNQDEDADFSRGEDISQDQDILPSQ
jgi:hypothetical protein